MEWDYERVFSGAGRRGCYDRIYLEHGMSTVGIRPTYGWGGRRGQLRRDRQRVL